MASLKALSKTSGAVLAAVAWQANAQSFQKTEFQTETLRPPIWMIGEYYVVSQENGDEYLYVIPSVYNKISEDNPYSPTNGSIVSIYAQFEGVARDPKEVAVSSEDADPIPWYESWTCNMKYYEDVTDKEKSDIVDNIFYEGTSLISSKGGTYQSANTDDQVSNSAWKNDPEISIVRESSENAVGDKYMIYQCGMYRKFFDDFSTVNLKVGNTIPWVFGYRVYKSLGDFTVDIQDSGEGEIKLIESAVLSGAFTAFSSSIALALIAAVAVLAF